MNKPSKQLVGIKYEILPLKILKETSGNPQKMTDQEMKGLIKSMKEKGWILDAPVCWKRPDGEYQIISGHHRIEAGIQAGIVETGCKVVEGITEDQALLFVVEANKRKGEFDEFNLNNFISEISERFNIEIDEIIKEVGYTEEEYNCFDQKINFIDNLEAGNFLDLVRNEQDFFAMTFQFDKKYKELFDNIDKKLLTEKIIEIISNGL